MKKVVFILIFMTSLVVFSQEKLNVFDVARSGSAADAKKLVKENKNIFNTSNKEGYAPLTLACYRGNIEVVKIILKQKNYINVNSNMGTPLMAATVKGNTDIVKLLLNANADVNLPDSSGTTPLIFATIFKYTPIIKMLLKENADKTIKDNNGKTAFEFATMSGDEEIINLLK